MDFGRRSKRILAKKLSRICAKGSRLFLQGLFLADIVKTMHIVFLPYFVTRHLCLLVRYVVSKHNGHGKVFLHIIGEIVCRQTCEHHHAEKYQHKCRTNAKGHHLKTNSVFS